MSEKELPRTCTVLTSNKTGGTLYLVGTAHFSKESQADVARVIQKTQVKERLLFLRPLIHYFCVYSQMF